MPSPVSTRVHGRLPNVSRLRWHRPRTSVIGTELVQKHEFIDRGLVLYSILGRMLHVRFQSVE